MIAYTLNEVLLIHSHEIIKNCVISVFNNEGNLVNRINMRNIDFASFLLPVQTGRYTIMINTEKEEKMIKANIVESKTSQNQINKRIKEKKLNTKGRNLVKPA